MSGEPKLRTIVALLVMAVGLGIVTWYFTKGGRDTGRGGPSTPAVSPAPAAKSPPAAAPGPTASAAGSAEKPGTAIELVAPPEPAPKGAPASEAKALTESPETDPRLAPGDTAWVSVVDEAGRAIAGATIVLATREGGVPIEEWIGTTGADGTLAFRRPADPEAIIRAIAPLRREASAPLADGAARILLPPSVAIPVSIASAPPPPAIERIRLLGADGARAGREGDWTRASEGALVGCPGPGTYRVEVHAAGFAPAVSGPIEVKDGESPPRVVMTLESAPALRGRVTAAATGSPAGDAEIEIRRAGPDLERAIELLGLRVTDRRGEIVVRIRAASDGTFAIEGLPAGAYRAWGRARGFGESSSAPFEVPSAGEIEIALDPGGAIRGSMPAGTAGLAAAIRTDGLFRIAPIGPDGSFEIRDLPAGSYGVVSLPAASPEPPAGFPIELRAGAVVSLSAGTGGAASKAGG